MKKIIIAGINSGAGKTTVSAALMKVFTDRGLKVAPFKTGPDYIDPKFHEFITGADSHNLDSWMLDEDTVRHIFYKNSGTADIAVIEGVMGLFDGCGSGDSGSTAHISRITGSPVILVADAKGMSRSIAAAINGYCKFDPSINIKGVILNRVSGERHYSLLKKIIDENCDVKCFGYLPADEGIILESRHLGLIPAEELLGLDDKIRRMAELAESTIDIGGILEAAVDDYSSHVVHELPEDIKGSGSGLKIAVAMDRAFSFYYRENLLLIKESGIELVYFSPMEDKTLPDGIDGVYLGGGYPEVFAKELSANTAMLDNMRTKCTNGMPVYAECGGLIYLTSGITGHDGVFYPMADFFKCRSVMTKRLQRFGYVNIQFDGIEVKGHEFHHSIIVECDEHSVFKYIVTKESTGDSWNCGLKKQNVLAGYPHIHFYSNFDFFRKLVEMFKGSPRNHSAPAPPEGAKN
ncbi:MAG: cobyrinate a,c-diamide synthase [Spirochaetae bacterium HGW-Spirochaetae-5]|nr:MAG: cobyrinate a,c-diamide synthase [Spirochaetae bacterium HGW-Spirochaetae-5]